MTGAVDMRCPCCGGAVDVPTFDMVVERYNVSKDQAVVLEAIWRGKGSSVPAHRIFDAMYANDMRGGPSEGMMYSALKQRIFKLREKLKGSGVGIEHTYPRGYRITMDRRQ